MKKTPCILAMICLFLLVGCTTRIADLSIIASHNVSFEKMDIDAMPQVKRVTGKDSKFIFLFIPFGIPTIEEALDDALEKGDGDLMIDAVLYRSGWWFLVGETSIVMKGTVVKTRGVK